MKSSFTLPITMLVAAPVMAQEYNLDANAHLYENGIEVVHGHSTSETYATQYRTADDGRSMAQAWSYSTGVLGAMASVSESGCCVATGIGPGVSLLSLPTPSGERSALGAALWETTITNNHATVVDYRFLFNIVAPNLGTQGHAGDVAGIYIDILLNGGSIWSATAEMHGASLAADGIFGPAVSHMPNSYHFNSFTAGVDLGSMVAGETFTLSYHLSTFADTASLDTGRVWASVGDPAGVEGSPYQLLTSGVVPEPATWAMLIAGFGMVGIAARRRRIARFA